jgi:hypothetical protein
MKNRYIIWMLLMLCSSAIFAQKANYSVNGSIYDEDTYSPVKNAIVTIKNKSNTYQVCTDLRGSFEIDNMEEGIYTYVVEAKDYMFIKTGNFTITSSRMVKYLNIHLINYSNRNIHGYVIRNPIMLAPNQNINAIAAYFRGVDSRNGETPSIKGSRPENTAYYIDGVRVNYNTGELIIGKQ